MEDEVIYEKKGLTSSTLGKTFFWMFMGLLATGIIAWYTYSSGFVLKLNFAGLAILELVVVLIFSACFKKLPASVVTFLYFVYAIINGFTFSTIFYVYELGSIASIFIITAGMFGVLGYIGTKTEKDITGWGPILMGILIAGLVVSLINLFIGSAFINTVIDWVILLVFGGITIYDINKIKNLEGFVDDDKLYIYGAMEIYLDFINIFIRLLSLFGKRRN